MYWFSWTKSTLFMIYWCISNLCICPDSVAHFFLGYHVHVQCLYCKNSVRRHINFLVSVILYVYVPYMYASILVPLSTGFHAYRQRFLRFHGVFQIIVVLRSQSSNWSHSMLYMFSFWIRRISYDANNICLLGQLFPSMAHTCFPSYSSENLQVFAQIGKVVYAFNGLC